MRPKFVGRVEVDVDGFAGTDGQLVVGFKVDVVGLVDEQDLPSCTSQSCLLVSRKKLNGATVGELVGQQGLVPPCRNEDALRNHYLDEVPNRTPAKMRHGFPYDADLGLLCAGLFD